MPLISAVHEWAHGFKWETDATFAASPWYPVGGAALYFAGVFVIKRMQTAPWKSLAVGTVHNAFLVLLSFAMMCGTLYGASVRSEEDGGVVNGLFCSKRSAETMWDGPLGAVVYIFYLSKYYEFFDTVFLALAQKPTIPLHLWHHAAMPFVTWSWLSGPWLEGAWWCAFVNSLIHTIMYSYYLATLLGQRVWFKKYITTCQIVQFCTGIVVSATFAYLKLNGSGCSSEWWPAVLSNAVNVSFLILFVRFARQTYAKKGETSKTRVSDEKMAKKKAGLVLSSEDAHAADTFDSEDSSDYEASSDSSEYERAVLESEKKAQ